MLPGEIRGLVGTNGSGKSTLIKVLSGVHAASPGSHISVDGDSDRRHRYEPAQLQRLGLTFVHQDLGLVDSLSVADNVRTRAVPGTPAEPHDSPWCGELRYGEDAPESRQHHFPLKVGRRARCGRPRDRGGGPGASGSSSGQGLHRL